jgi:hypothetical protein
MGRDRTQRFLEADVKCYLCGATAGVLRREDAVGCTTIQFQCNGGSQTIVESLTGLRCDRCYGSLYADEVEITYYHPFAEEPLERPRRGRPPKQLGRKDESKSA